MRGCGCYLRFSSPIEPFENTFSCCECINSHAKALGIEHPKVRNGRSVRHLDSPLISNTIKTFRQEN
jgi:hypothetical protein